MLVRNERFAKSCLVLRRLHPSAPDSPAPIVVIDCPRLKSARVLQRSGLDGIVAVNRDDEAGFSARCKRRGVEPFVGTLTQYCRGRAAEGGQALLAVYADTTAAKPQYVLENLLEAIAAGAACIQLTFIMRSHHGLVEKTYQAALHCAWLHGYEPLGGWRRLAGALLQNEKAYALTVVRCGLAPAAHAQMLKVPSAAEFQLSPCNVRGAALASPWPTLAAVRALLTRCTSSNSFDSGRWRRVRRTVVLLSPRQQRRALALLAAVPGGKENYLRWQRQWFVRRQTSRPLVTPIEIASADAAHWANLAARLGPRILVEFSGRRIPVVMEQLRQHRSSSELLATGVSPDDLGPGHKAAMTKGQRPPELVEAATTQPRYLALADAMLLVAEDDPTVTEELQRRLLALLPLLKRGGAIGWAVSMSTGRRPVLHFAQLTQWLAERNYVPVKRAAAAWPVEDRSSWTSELYERLVA